MEKKISLTLTVIWYVLKKNFKIHVQQLLKYPRTKTIKG